MPDALSPSITARFGILLREKVWLTVALNLFFWTGYSLLARFAIFPVREVPLTRIDRVIPFQPQLWTPFYLSEYIITFFIPWLITKRIELRNYVHGLLIMSCACFAIFFFFPTASPRPQILPDQPLYHFVLWMDGPLNAFPSLHAAFLVFTLCLTREILRPLHGSVWIALWLWSGAILYATIATRQHYAADLIAGTLIGYASHSFAWRVRKAPADTSASTVLSCASQSHGGAR